MAENDNRIECATDRHVSDKAEGVPFLYGRKLSFAFEGKIPIVAVKEVDFGLDRGQITAVIGESGSGKSTLLKLIYGLLEPTSGEVRYDGVRVPSPHARLIPGHPAMRMVSQSFDDLNTYAKAWDNVASRLSNVDVKAKEEKTSNILEVLRINHRAQHRVFDLSGGEKQRVAIARALVDDPHVLLLDEPFNQVDASFRDQLQQDIRDIVDRTGLTVIMVSHDPDEVMAMADHLLVMWEGAVVAAGSPIDLYREPPNGYTARLLAQSNILSAIEARSLGLSGDSEVAIHPEWITLSEAGILKGEITGVAYKGRYEEVWVSVKNIRLKTVTFEIGRYKKGQQVEFAIEHTHAIR